MKQALLTKLNSLIAQKGKFQAEIASALGLTQPHFSMILSGKRNVTPQIAQKLETIFGKKNLPWGDWFKEDADDSRAGKITVKL